MIDRQRYCNLVASGDPSHRAQHRWDLNEDSAGIVTRSRRGRPAAQIMFGIAKTGGTSQPGAGFRQQACRIRLGEILSPALWPQKQNGAAVIAAPPGRRSMKYSGGAKPQLRTAPCPHSDLSIFQKIGVAGPSSTPVSDFRHALGPKYCPSGI